MPDLIETTLAGALGDSTSIGQVLIQGTAGNCFTLCHRDDHPSSKLTNFRRPDDAIEIGKFDDAGNYRPLKTAPNLRRGWRLDLLDLGELRQALDHFYPGRLAMLLASNENRLAATPLRETLNRQSGMYRVAAKISDQQIDHLVGDFCRSDGGCLRTILWRRDANGSIPSTKLPSQKFDPAFDQTGRGERAIPLLCQEACNLLVAECRKAVKDETNKE
ncbi:MAG TPA: DR2241 family protein [Chthoniobacterales bacterium]|nr:DR2241 family protein [Chthoniobacterales bacterium]